MEGRQKRSDARVALDCLVHPASLIALVLLGLNDHLWKGSGPGWLTGKLSDFAGLFYFPFLVMVVVGLVGLAVGKRVRFGSGVFIAIGVWFAGLKTIPAVHAASVAVLELLLGDVAIVLDPTDAFAVVALLPSWTLFRRIENRPQLRASRVLRPAALVVALGLTTATSQPPEPRVTKLITFDNKLFAVVETNRSDMTTGSGSMVYESSDGKTWTATSELPRDFIAEHQTQSSLDVSGSTLWLGERSVSGSGPDDSWSISTARQRFMNGAGADYWSARDIANVPSSPETVVVALGRQGVVVRDRARGWTRHAVGEAVPTPTRVDFADVTELFLQGQFVFGIAVALLAWALFALLAWTAPLPPSIPTATSNERPRLLSRLRAVFRLGQWRTRSFGIADFFFGAIPALLAVASCFFMLATGADPLVAVLSILLLMTAFVLLLLGWFFSRRERGRVPTGLVPAIAAGLVAVGGLALWQLSIFESITPVAIISALAVCLVLILFGRRA